MNKNDLCLPDIRIAVRFLQSMKTALARQGLHSIVKYSVQGHLPAELHIFVRNSSERSFKS